MGQVLPYRSQASAVFSNVSEGKAVAVLSLSPSQASNIDDVLGHHTSFLDTCLKDCMLTNPELLKVFSKLMSVCVMFTNCMQVRRGGWFGPLWHAALLVPSPLLAEPLGLPDQYTAS